MVIEGIDPLFAMDAFGKHSYNPLSYLEGTSSVPLISPCRGMVAHEVSRKIAFGLHQAKHGQSLAAAFPEFQDLLPDGDTQNLMWYWRFHILQQGRQNSALKLLCQRAS